MQLRIALVGVSLLALSMGARPASAMAEPPHMRWLSSLPKAPNDGRSIINWEHCWKTPKGSLPQGGFKVACRPVIDHVPANFALLTSKNDKPDLNAYRVQIQAEVQTLHEVSKGGVRVVPFEPHVLSVACYNHPDKTCSAFLMTWVEHAIEVQDFSTADPDLKHAHAEMMELVPEVKPLPNLDSVFDQITHGRSQPERCAAVRNAQADFTAIAKFEAEHYYIADLQGFLLPDGHFQVMDPSRGEKKGPGRSTTTALESIKAYLLHHKC